MSSSSSSASSSLLPPIPTQPTKTVVVLGAAYGGARASRLISNSLPKGWRLVVIERNTHFNHVYAFPRYTVLSKHAPKGYIPYTNHLTVRTPPPTANTTDISKPPTPPLTPKSSTSSLPDEQPEDDPSKYRQLINGSVVSLTAHSVTFTRPGNGHGKEASSAEEGTALSGPRYHFDGPEETINFDYCIYALGASLPDPCNVWKEHPNMPNEIVTDHHEKGLGSKKNGIRWMEEKAETLKKADTIVIVGGGALGIQFAGDIKYVYPSKRVTLLHSRTRVMPIYPQEMHDILIERLQNLGVKVILGERVLEWPEEPEYLNGKQKRVVTDKGTVLTADIVLPCTGQKPHSQYMAQLCPEAISKVNGRILITPTLQVNPLTSNGISDRLSNLSIQTPPSTPPATRSVSLDRGMIPDLSHMFAIGDCANSGAIQAGHTAYWQGEVAARNVLRLIERDEGRGEKDLELEVYKSGKPAIKVTVGLKEGVISNKEGTVLNTEGVEDLQARLIWPSIQAEDLPDDA